MIEDMIPTRGYLSAQDPRLNFGLGKSRSCRFDRDPLAGWQKR